MGVEPQDGLSVIKRKDESFQSPLPGEHSNVVSGIPHHLRPQDRRPGVGLVG